MEITKTEALALALYQDRPAVSGSQRRTLEAIFCHPSPHNLEWTDVVALIGKIGKVDKKAHSKFSFKVAGERHLMHKPRTKDFTGSEVIALRHFLTRAKWSPESPSQPAAHPIPTPPSLMVVVDDHEAKIYHMSVRSDDAAVHEIRP